LLSVLLSFSFLFEPSFVFLRDLVGSTELKALAHQIAEHFKINFIPEEAVDAKIGSIL